MCSLYDLHVRGVSDNFKRVLVDPSYIDKISDFVKELIIVKKTERHHQQDSEKELKRFTTGFVGEASIEKLLGISIIDWSIGASSVYHHPDIPGYSLGIKTVEQEKFPVIFKKNYYPQIICIRSVKIPNLVFVCGIASTEVLDTYQDVDLILDPRLRARGTKTGFYGFQYLEPLNSLQDIIKYKK